MQEKKHSTFARMLRGMTYAGYVAWRATVLLSQVLTPECFQQQIPYFVYPQGHILLYTIPAKDYALHGNVLLLTINNLQKQQKRIKSPKFAVV